MCGAGPSSSSGTQLDRVSQCRTTGAAVVRPRGECVVAVDRATNHADDPRDAELTIRRDHVDARGTARRVERFPPDVDRDLERVGIAPDLLAALTDRWHSRANLARCHAVDVQLVSVFGGQTPGHIGT